MLYCNTTLSGPLGSRPGAYHWSTAREDREKIDDLMKKRDVTKQILMGSEEGGKTYQFNDTHDSDQPAQMWFQESNEGLILFVVFYTQACRWSRCLGCNLPSLCALDHVPYGNLINQIDRLFADPEVTAKGGDIKKLIVSNNGSVLDEATFSSTALMYLMARINLNLPNLNVLCLETRPEYVDLPELEFLARALHEGDTPTKMELAVGFEAFDDRIRNDMFHKGLDLEVFERFIGNVSRYEYRVKTYFMQKPVPHMTDKEAVSDIHQAIDYLAGMSGQYGVKINMHLNPTYVARGTFLEDSFNKGEFAPPRLVDVARAALHAQDKPISIFLGLYDEGLAVPGGGFIRQGEEKLVEEMERFNRTEDYNILKALVG
jgi:radical SAM enzyme (TIGR01210 family)